MIFQSDYIHSLSSFNQKTGIDFEDGSDEELRRLAMQIDDGIYDPLASLKNVKQRAASQHGRDKEGTSKQSIENWVRSVTESQAGSGISAPPITPGEPHDVGGSDAAKTPQQMDNPTNGSPDKPKEETDPQQSSESAQPPPEAEKVTDDKPQGDDKKEAVDETTKNPEGKGVVLITNYLAGTQR